MIEEYFFGRMRVDGKSFSHDLIIFHAHIKENWWRLEGHRLQLADMQEVLDSKPETIIVGTGHNGVMEVSPEVRAYCKNAGIIIIELVTAQAVRKYNELAGPGVVGLFHLTC